MTHLPARLEINIASIPVKGFGGMCLVLTSLLCAATVPPTRWFMIASMASGVVFGLLRIVLRGAGGGGRTHTLVKGTEF